MKRGAPLRRTPLKRTPLKRGTVRKPIPNAEGFAWELDAAKDVVRGRSKGRCEYEACMSVGEQFHHRMPRRSGGSRLWNIHSPANLVHLCCHHHAHVESHRAEAIRDGLVIPLGENFEHCGVRLRHGYVFLLPSGNMTRQSPLTRDN